jgi:hypothetical protein
MLKNTLIFLVRFQVLKTTSMKITVLWHLALCSVLEITNVSETLAASVIALKTEEARTSETSKNFC